MSSLDPLVRTRNLREMVLARIRNAIISGEMTPGEVYSAPTLAGALGVSATPVREAMLELAHQGLVESLRNKGFRVTEVSDSDLDEIASIRLLLEPPTLVTVVPLVPEADFPLLRARADEIVQCARDGDLSGYLEADLQFHGALLSYCGNKRLLDLITSLRSNTRLFGLRGLLEHGQLESSAAEHHLILDAVVARDASRAGELLVSHIGHVRGIWAGKSQDDTAAS